MIEIAVEPSADIARKGNSRPFLAFPTYKSHSRSQKMRTFSIVALLASMAMGVPAMAQTMPTSDYSANNGTAMDGHPAMNNQSMMRHNNKPHAHALGSMRHPTVGNTANQRVNGG